VVVIFGAGGGRVVTVAIDGKLQGLGVGPLNIAFPGSPTQPSARSDTGMCRLMAFIRLTLSGLVRYRGRIEQVGRIAWGSNAASYPLGV
jgi:hypothetical protein